MIGYDPGLPKYADQTRQRNTPAVTAVIQAVNTKYAAQTRQRNTTRRRIRIEQQRDNLVTTPDVFVDDVGSDCGDMRVMAADQTLDRGLTLGLVIDECRHTWVFAEH